MIYQIWLVDFEVILESDGKFYLLESSFNLKIIVNCEKDIENTIHEFVSNLAFDNIEIQLLEYFDQEKTIKQMSIILELIEDKIFEKAQYAWDNREE